MKTGHAVRRLGDLVDCMGGGTPSRGTPEYWSGSIPWASVKDLDEHEHELTRTEESITQGGLDNSASNLIPAGTVIVATRVGLGKVCINRMPVAINQDLKALIPKNGEILPQYLLYFMVSQAEAIKRSGVGATVKGITLADLQRLELVLPPLPEQERLVRLLDEAEALRRLRAQADRRMGQFVAALFSEMFGDPESNREDLPLVQVSTFVDHFVGGRNITAEDSGHPICRVLKVSAVTWGEYRPDECKAVPEDYAPPAEHEVKPGDLLFSRANTTELVGATAYVFETPTGRLLSDKLWRFAWREPRSVEPLYIWALFQTPWVRRELGRRSTGTSGSMKNISMPKVLSMSLPVAPMPRQRNFVERYLAARKLLTMQATSRRRLDDLFQSLLHRAFRGEL